MLLSHLVIHSCDSTDTDEEQWVAASMFIWGEIRDWFSERTKAMGVEETSFPLFLSATSLEKEKAHVEGFAPELAWVTKAVG